MLWYHYFALAALFVSMTSLTFHVIRFLRLGPPKDFSRKKGDIRSSVAYSFIGAMNPAKKESAYLHLPTYAAGLLYHGGTFISIAVFFSFLFGVDYSGWIQWVLITIFTVSVISGSGILVKRIMVKKIRSFSNLDDYLSNILVTAFQITTLLVLVSEVFLPIYFITVGILLLYIPLGKLKHAFYFFAARYQLGLFYGWRGIWPVRKP